MHVLITGADGFVGRALFKMMIAQGWQVRGTVRSLNQFDSLPLNTDLLQIESIGLDTNWTDALNGVDMVVHLAARVPYMKDPAADPFAEFYKVNVQGSQCLALAAAQYGVKRFIFMSSVKVQKSGGEHTLDKGGDRQEPRDHYGISKWEAEKALYKIVDKTEMDLVVLRSPLVYGPRVKGNFLRLLEIIERGIPLPLAGIDNKRSLIYLENLINAIITCMKHPRAIGQTYLVSDGEDVSTPELIRRMGSAIGRPARLFPFPPLLLSMAGCISGKSDTIERLIGSLMVDSSKIKRELDWEPPYTMAQGLKETAKWYLNKN